eukprot:1256956-Amphidinium_carterae.1
MELLMPCCTSAKTLRATIASNWRRMCPNYALSCAAIDSSSAALCTLDRVCSHSTPRAQWAGSETAGTVGVHGGQPRRSGNNFGNVGPKREAN